MTLCHVNEKICLTIRFLVGKSAAQTVLGTIRNFFKDDAKIETA
jgi:hypothetical protein